MATAWVRVRSLSCKSSAVADDVYSPPTPQLPKKHPPEAVKGSVAVKPAKENRRSRSMEQNRPARSKKKKNASELARKPEQLTTQLSPSPMASPKRASSGSLLAMTELPEGHSSRRIVELIFAAGWDDFAPREAEIEALFRVQSTARAVARFENARAAAQARGAAEADSRCAADGNEMMRFQCLLADDDSVICATVATTKLSAVRTFASSGAADASATGGGGGGGGRRAMLVCRVIAGRVRRAADHPCHAGACHSVAGGGELVVLDRRGVLPCFLVVYRVKPALDSSSSCRSR